MQLDIDVRIEGEVPVVLDVLDWNALLFGKEEDGLVARIVGLDVVLEHAPDVELREQPGACADALRLEIREHKKINLLDALPVQVRDCLLPKGQLIIIGTILHPLSVLEDILEMPNEWHKERYKAYHDGIQEEGHELWAAERPHEWLQKRKAEIGSWAFASEYLNNPIMDETAPIKPEHIRYWQEVPENISLVISVDPAYSEDVRSDYKTASLIGADHLGNRYLIEYIHTHKPVGEYQDSILNLYERFKNRITAIGVPRGGIESEFYRSLLQKAAERKVYPPFVELKNSFRTASGSTIREKKSRIIAALQPLFEQGKYYIGKDHHEAREELLSIGNSRWDDLVDTMAYAEQILQPYYKDTSKDFTIDKYGTKEYKNQAPAHMADYGMDW